MKAKDPPAASKNFIGGLLSIKFASRLAAHFALASFFKLTMAGQAGVLAVKFVWAMGSDALTNVFPRLLARHCHARAASLSMSHLRLVVIRSMLAVCLTGAPWLFCGAQQESSKPQQQSEPTPSPRPETRSSQNEGAGTKAEEEKKIERKEQSQRILGVLPQFGVTSRQNAPPLTPGNKFHLFFKSAFDPVSIGVVGMQAGLSQAQDEFPAYGQGAKGYGKRFCASLADEV